MSKHESGLVVSRIGKAPGTVIAPTGISARGARFPFDVTHRYTGDTAFAHVDGRVLSSIIHAVVFSAAGREGDFIRLCRRFVEKDAGIHTGT